MIAVAAIPVAIISNFVRVIVLVLVTYYLGDAAAQGFLHDFAGLLMFSVALLAIFGLISLPNRSFTRLRREGASVKPAFDNFTEPKTDRRKFLLGLLFCSAAGVAAWRQPNQTRLSRETRNSRTSFRSGLAHGLCCGKRTGRSS